MYRLMLLIGAFLQNIGKNAQKSPTLNTLIYTIKKKTPRTLDKTRFLGVEILLNISTWLNESRTLLYFKALYINVCEVFYPN